MARLLFFGKLGDIAGGRERDVPLQGVNSVSALIEKIEAGDAVLGEALRSPSVRCIVNEDMISGDAKITDADEIAFIPPVSGG